MIYSSFFTILVHTPHCVITNLHILLSIYRSFPLVAGQWLSFSQCGKIRMFIWICRNILFLWLGKITESGIPKWILRDVSNFKENKNAMKMRTCFSTYITQSTRNYITIKIYTKIKISNSHNISFCFCVSICNTILFPNVTVTHYLKTGSKTIFSNMTHNRCISDNWQP